MKIKRCNFVSQKRKECGGEIFEIHSHQSHNRNFYNCNGRIDKRSFIISNISPHLRKLINTHTIHTYAYRPHTDKQTHHTRMHTHRPHTHRETHTTTRAWIHTPTHRHKPRQHTDLISHMSPKHSIFPFLSHSVFPSLFVSLSL